MFWKKTKVVLFLLTFGLVTLASCTIIRPDYRIRFYKGKTLIAVEYVKHDSKIDQSKLTAIEGRLSDYSKIGWSTNIDTYVPVDFTQMNQNIDCYAFEIDPHYGLKMDRDQNYFYSIITQGNVRPNEIITFEAGLFKESVLYPADQYKLLVYADGLLLNPTIVDDNVSTYEVTVIDHDVVITVGYLLRESDLSIIARVKAELLNLYTEDLTGQSTVQVTREDGVILHWSTSCTAMHVDTYGTIIIIPSETKGIITLTLTLVKGDSVDYLVFYYDLQ